MECDLRRDCCGRCTRANLECSDYHDPSQLRFRDESPLTRQKALIRSSHILQGTLTVPIDERARGAFFLNHAYGLSKTYNVLPILYSPSLSRNHLAISVDAVSLAFLSIQYDSPQASQRARLKYLNALPLNNALKCPQHATSDSTLLTVLLLDFYEEVTSGNPRSSSSWMSYLNGASGPSQAPPP